VVEVDSVPRRTMMRLTLPIVDPPAGKRRRGKRARRPDVGNSR